MTTDAKNSVSKQRLAGSSADHFFRVLQKLGQAWVCQSAKESVTRIQPK
jgi:hypothetical protein